jgi:4'-phosphopantetheinyl transferase
MSGPATSWDHPRGRYVLPQDEVHVWRTNIDWPADRITQIRQVLSPEEQARADQFHFAVDRMRCIIGRGVLRMLVGHCLGIPPDTLRLGQNRFGKPCLLAGRAPTLQFNVSHSGELILIALAFERDVGVDVERIRTELATAEIAARYFSPRECRALMGLAADLQSDAFFTCWTRKEAYIKARGDGLALPLDQFDVSFLPDEPARLVETRHDPTEVDRWTLHGLDSGRADHKAAVAAEGLAWALKCWSWPADAGPLVR